MKNKDLIDKVKQHTVKKIEYVSEYSREWLWVACESSNINEIVFIDAMCNSGHYKTEKGDVIDATCIRVIKQIINFCNQPNCINKTFKIYLNDYDKKRIDYLSNLITKMDVEKFSNVKIYISSKDVNKYLIELKSYFKDFKKRLILLYVDPYNIGTVKINLIKEFLDTYYAELILNFYINDYMRNKNNDSNIRNCLEDIILNNEKLSDITIEKLCNRVANYLRSSKHIKFVFRYLFKNKKNADLYYIIYATPHEKGLEKLKKVLWKIFKGKQYYRLENALKGQISLFNNSDNESMRLEQYAINFTNIIYKKYKGKKVSYREIWEYVLEYTMLREGQIIENILKPLVKEYNVIKTGKATKYRDEYYNFENRINNEQNKN